jgi:hypothetical protein
MLHFVISLMSLIWDEIFEPRSYSRKKTNRVKARNVKKGKSTNKEDKKDSSDDDYDAWEVVSTQRHFQRKENSDIT